MISVWQGKQINEMAWKGQRLRAAVTQGKVFYKKDITLVNMIANGSFESASIANLTANGNPSRVALPSVHGEYGAYCATYSGNVNSESGGPGGQSIFAAIGAYNVVVGRKYYVRSMAMLGNANLTGASFFNGAAIGSPGLSPNTPLPETAVGLTPMPTANTWYLMDYLWTANASTLNLSIHFSRVAGNMARLWWLDNWMLIDVTTAFGAGYEPNEPAMRGIVADMGGYFEGTGVW